MLFFFSILPCRGYDVWLPNSRGSRNARNHVSKNPDVPASGFWNFTWHEMGIFDHPPVIDLPLRVRSINDIDVFDFPNKKAFHSREHCLPNLDPQTLSSKNCMLLFVLEMDVIWP